MSERYTIGVDFGTQSGRAVVVRVSDGHELATAVTEYQDGVIDRTLPSTGQPLPPEWALQNPSDYLDVLKDAVKRAVQLSGVDPTSVVGIGIDFTACTMLPTTANGTPLCEVPEFRSNPHAWVKLWKHHAAQPEADLINQTAAARNETWLKRYGGKISSEWFFAKALQILDEAPEVYAGADRFIEAADWVVWRLCGVETRNTCTAGYKAMYQEGAFPTPDFFGALHPGFRDVIATKMMTELAALGGKLASSLQKPRRGRGFVPELP
jgi:L-ribulokinase